MVAAFKQYEISNQEFETFKSFIYDSAGIMLSNEKRTLVTARLSKRLRHYQLASFGEYFNQYVANPVSKERQIAIDLLTTNETYFFREPAHFDFLKKELKNWRGHTAPYRVWSAASSSGEEAFTIAMVLQDVLGVRPWEIIGTDISTQIIEKARTGHYLMNRIEGIPKHYLQQYCLKGTGQHEGTMLINKKLRDRVHFHHANLKEALPNIGMFDLVFLRNVLIYFDNQTKEKIIRNISQHMKPGAYLLIGHSESLKKIPSDLDSLGPSVYRLTK